MWLCDLMFGTADRETSSQIGGKINASADSELRSELDYKGSQIGTESHEFHSSLDRESRTTTAYQAGLIQFYNAWFLHLLRRHSAQGLFPQQHPANCQGLHLLPGAVRMTAAHLSSFVGSSVQPVARRFRDICFRFFRRWVFY